MPKFYFTRTTSIRGSMNANDFYTAESKARLTALTDEDVTVTERSEDMEVWLADDEPEDRPSNLPSRVV